MALLICSNLTKFKFLPSLQSRFRSLELYPAVHSSLLPIIKCSLSETAVSSASSIPTAADVTMQEPGYSKTFYKRTLPSPPCTEFSSEQGKQIFAQALEAGTMNSFFKLIEQFRTQDEPAYCGLASISMVLNSLSIDPRRPWKGPWRFFHEGQLDCCHPLEKVREEGVTLEQAACLARCNGAKVEVFPFGSTSLEGFRNMVLEACTSGDHHIVVSYSRQEMQQTGDGHFSPIGGYSQAEDSVLILDTARFKYPPHWVPLPLLYTAMSRIDTVTGKPRGFIRLGSHPVMNSVLFTLDVRDSGWQKAFKYIETGIIHAVEEQGKHRQFLAASPDNNNGLATSSTSISTAEQQQNEKKKKIDITTQVLKAALSQAPIHELSTFLAVRTMGGTGCEEGTCTQTTMIETFLQELYSMPLYSQVKALVASDSSSSVLSSTKPQPATTAAAVKEGTNNNTSCCHTNENDAAYGQEYITRDYTIERLCIALLLVPRSHYLQAVSADMHDAVRELFDTSHKEVIAIEVAYLRHQFKELPAIQHAIDQAEAAAANAVGQE